MTGATADVAKLGRALAEPPEPSPMSTSGGVHMMIAADGGIHSLFELSGIYP